MAADIAVIMGSKSDLPSLKGAFDTLKKFGLSFEARVLSAHRTPDALTPAIRTAVKPRMKYRDLSENKPVTEKSDPALNRARGLLLSLDTLNKKWRK